jgi:hypothetical protein
LSIRAASVCERSVCDEPTGRRARRTGGSGWARRETHLRPTGPASRQSSPSCGILIRRGGTRRRCSWFRTTDPSRRRRLTVPSETHFFRFHTIGGGSETPPPLSVVSFRQKLFFPPAGFARFQASLASVRQPDAYLRGSTVSPAGSGGKVHDRSAISHNECSRRHSTQEDLRDRHRLPGSIIKRL